QDLPPAPDDKFMEFRGWITESAAIRLMQLTGKDLDELRRSAGSKDFRAVPLGSTTSLDLPVHLQTIHSANVIGMLPGTDPALRREAVLYTAHHDHLGRVQPIPPIPSNRIAADINLDTVNRWGRTTDLGVMGLGKSTADDVVRKVAAEQGRTVHGDPQPDRGSFYRSDMFSMAHVGVPPVAVKGGPDYVGRPKGWGEEQALDYERHHYHQPSDEYHGDWDFSGAVQDAQLQLLVGLR